MSGFAFGADAYNDWGRCEGMDFGLANPTTTDPEPEFTPKFSLEDMEAAFPAAVGTPLWFGNSTKVTFSKWWHLVTQLPDYVVNPDAVKALADGVVARFTAIGEDIMGVLRAIDVAVRSPVAALHLPVVYSKVFEAHRSTRRVPCPYLVATAKSLTLRQLLTDSGLEAHTHWAEAQLPREGRVYLVPHTNPPEPPEEHRESITQAVSQAQAEFHDQLWKLTEVVESVVPGLPRAVHDPDFNALRVKRDLYRKVLAYGDISADRATLEGVISEIDQREALELAVMRKNWFNSLGGCI